MFQDYKSIEQKLVNTLIMLLLFWEIRLNTAEKKQIILISPQNWQIRQCKNVVV